MQSTGHASTHAASFVPMHGSAITYAIASLSHSLQNWCCLFGHNSSSTVRPACKSARYSPEKSPNLDSLRYHTFMPSDPKPPRPLAPILRALVEIGFIIFLFYSNLLMGEFNRAGG